MTESKVDPTVIPPYILVDYAWEALKRNVDASEENYDDVIPFSPLGEEPELTEFSEPFIVYGYAETPTADLPAQHRGNMAFVVYCQNFRKLSRWVNVLSRVFENADESARRVNEFSSTLDHYKGIRFGYIQLSYVEGGSPEETEGGRMSAAVNVRYEYYVDYDIETNFANSTWP